MTKTQAALTDGPSPTNGTGVVRPVAPTSSGRSHMIEVKGIVAKDSGCHRRGNSVTGTVRGGAGADGVSTSRASPTRTACPPIAQAFTYQWVRVDERHGHRDRRAPRPRTIYPTEDADVGKTHQGPGQLQRRTTGSTRTPLTSAETAAVSGQSDTCDRASGPPRMGPLVQDVDDGV